MSKICLITGSSGGIGKYTAIKLAQLDYQVIMLVRKSEKSNNAYQEILSKSKSKDVKMFHVDLSLQKSIRNVLEQIKAEYERIDLLINNAGVIKRKLELTEEGIEQTLAVNYFAPFLLTNSLMPLLKESKSSKIINLSSELYKKGEPIINNDFNKTKFDGNKIYSNSKCLINYFTYELSKSISGEGITVNSLHPGVLATDAFREYPKMISKILNLFLASPEEGAKNVMYLSTSDAVKNITGKYFNKTKISRIEEINADLSAKIWKDTENIINELDKKSL